MRFLRVSGLLLVAAAICQATLVLIANNGSLVIGARQAGEAVGKGLLLLAAAGCVAAAVAYKNRESEDDFPAFHAGLLSVLAFAAISYVIGGH